MATKKSKSPNGKVNAENLSGRPVPRGGLRDQTGGKTLGTRPGLRVRRSPYRFVTRGR